MSYDNWKLSNPIDDGCGYNMLSNCCGAKIKEDTDICKKCLDHCEPLEDYEYEEIQRENYLEMMRDGEKDER